MLRLFGVPASSSRGRGGGGEGGSGGGGGGGGEGVEGGSGGGGGGLGGLRPRAGVEVITRLGAAQAQPYLHL